MRVTTFFAVIIFCALSIAAKAAEIRVIASPGLTAAFKTIVPQFERATGHSLTIQYGLEAAQKQQIQSG